MGEEFVLDKLTYEVSQGHPDMKILNGQFVMALEFRREEWNSNSFARRPGPGRGGALGGH